MSNTIYKHRMLRMIEQEPRTLHDFTEGAINLTVAPWIVERYAAELLTEGCIRELGGKFRITGKGREEISRKTTKAEPTTFCAASTKGAYVPPVWNVRAGTDQHLQYRSRGLGV